MTQIMGGAKPAEPVVFATSIASHRVPVPHQSTSEALIAPALRRIERVVAFLRVWMIAAVVLPLSFLGAVAWTTYGLALADAQTLVQKTVELLDENTLEVFETQELILDQAVALASRAGQEPDYSELNEALKRLEKGRAQIASIWLLDEAGNARASSAPLFERLNGRDRDYFQAHVSADIGSYLGKAFVGRRTGQPSFGFSRRLPSRDGSFRGVVSISVSSDYFRDLFRRAAPEIDHVAALMRTDGEVLARDPPSSNPSPIPPDDPLMRAVALSDSGLLWRVSSTDGVERLYGYRRVTGYPLIVGMAVTRSAILRPWLASLLLYAGIAGATVLALAGLTVFALRETRREEAALLRLAAAARQREQIEARLRHSQKLEALGELTGTVAHDFGNLLTPILGNLHLLQERLDSPQSPSRVRAALTAAERGEKRVRALLSFARQQPLALTVIDVNALIGEMRELLAQSMGSTAELTIDLSPDVWPVRADAGGLEMAILNLIVNARDAMTARGAVRVSTANVADGAPVGLAGKFVAIAVSDTGSGMPPEVMARAFEPFFTTKAPNKGTGLGLASIYGFAKQCGGEVTIKSEVGKATTVTMYLPRAEPATT